MKEGYAIYGPYMAHIWPYMGHIWPYIGHICSYMAIYGHIWTIYGPCVAIVGPHLSLAGVAPSVRSSFAPALIGNEHLLSFRSLVVANPIRGRAYQESYGSVRFGYKICTVFGSYGFSVPWFSVPRFQFGSDNICLLYTSPSPRDRTRSRMPSSA